MTFPISPELRELLAAVIGAEGHPYVIGGAVRDWLLGMSPKDVDVEVYGVTAPELETTLSRFRVNAVGRAFGVLKVTIGDVTFDVSLPRRENKAGRGHKGFVVTPDPQMTYREGAGRRDFTINTMGWDCRNDRLVDPYDGLADLGAQTLRHISAAFSEDPLRVLRGCQFAARFGFNMHPETIALCRSLSGELDALPVERIWVEWQKLLLRSPRPSVGLSLLVETHAIDLFPEVKALLQVPQDPEWHPEGQDHPLGSLWVHNGMVTDAAVRVLDDDRITDDEERLIVLLGAFCHDLGKPETTKFSDGRWKSLRHDEAGQLPTRSFLARIGCPSAIVEAVVPLVANHLKPFQLARGHVSNAAIRRLAIKVPLTRLCRVARADFLGRTTPEALACVDSRAISETEWLLRKADELCVADAAPSPILMGRHLLTLGLAPGPAMGALIERAFQAQLDGAFHDETGALLWARECLGATE